MNSSESTYAATVLALAKNGRPDTAVCFAYQGGGKIVAIYSHANGNFETRGETLIWKKAQKVEFAEAKTGSLQLGEDQRLIYSPEQSHWELAR